MRTRTTAAGRRAGFTLVEVLVAAGLCLLIMTVMATAFQAGLDTLSQLKSLGGLQTQLRTAETVLRRDLQADHLESSYGNRVSDQRLDLWVPPGQPLPPGQQPAPPVWEPPQHGFFRIYHEPIAPGNAAVTVWEGNDPDGLPTTRATGHILHMAVRLPADRADQVFDANIPGVAANTLRGLGLQRLTNDTTFRSQWAEVVYFLDTTNPVGFTSPSATQASGLPLYSLHRRVRLLTEPRQAGAARVAWRNGANSVLDLDPQVKGMSYSPQAVAGTVNPLNPGAAAVPGFPLNDPADVTNPHNRLGGVGGFNPALTPTVAGTGGHSPFGSGRYNVSYQPTGLGPHVAAPTPLTWFDLMNGERRTVTAAGTTGAAGDSAGTDILMSGVVSFEVRVSYDVNPNVDLRYNVVADSTGSPLPLQNQTGFPQMSGNPLRLTPAQDRYDDDDPSNGPPCIIPLSRTGAGPLSTPVGHSGHPDGAFDDLPLSPYAGIIGAGPPPNGVGNPLFAPGAPSPGVSRPRVFDLWGTNLLPIQPTGNPNTFHSADWHMPVGFTTDTSTNPPGRGNLAGNPNCVPLPIRVKAIQIKLRVYDPKNKVTRQLTLIEAL